MRSLQNQQLTIFRLLAVIVAALTPLAVSAQAPKVIVVGERPMADAVKTLGCKLGVGQGAGNAAKINNYLASRPAYPLYIAGGALELDAKIVVPAMTGGYHIYGNGPTGDLNDNNYYPPEGIKVGRPTRLIWAGPPGDPMIQWDARLGSIRGIHFQGRPLPTTPTAQKAQVAIHVRTWQQTALPTGKLRIEDCSFQDVANAILFGYDIDTDINAADASIDPTFPIGRYNNADESCWHNLWFYFPFNPGADEGTLAAAASGNDNRTVTLDSVRSGTVLSGGTTTSGVIDMSSANESMGVGVVLKLTWAGGSMPLARCTAVSGTQITVQNLDTSPTAVTLPADGTAVTVSASHGIGQGAWVDVTWGTSSKRRGMRCISVSGANNETITLSGGKGDNLPPSQTAVYASEQRRCFVFRTEQAVAFGGGKIVSNGHAHEIFYFEKGSKLFQQYVSVNGWDAAKGASVPCYMLRLGRVNVSYYDIGFDLDATCTNVRLLKMDDPIVDNRCHVSFRGVISQITPNAGFAYEVPLVDAQGACQVMLRDLSFLQAGSIKLTGYAGQGVPGSGVGFRKGVAVCHLENCTLTGGANMVGRDVLDASSSGLHWLTMRDCQAAIGTSDPSGTASLPVEDDEALSPGLTKMPFNSP